VGAPGEAKEGGQGAGELGARGEGQAAVLPPALLRGLCRRGVGSLGRAFLCLSFVIFICYFLCRFLGALYIFLGQAWAGGQRELQLAAPAD
jgi:hypothetical protein